MENNHKVIKTRICYQLVEIDINGNVIDKNNNKSEEPKLEEQKEEEVE